MADSAWRSMAKAAMAIAGPSTLMTWARSGVRNLHASWARGRAIAELTTVAASMIMSWQAAIAIGAGPRHPKGGPAPGFAEWFKGKIGMNESPGK
ncbi:hypothetical protein [Streptomyces uncialis]|uniref:hypothetical protein n=1 Tax=Streptomyces uncialis TaxID=1048205 RepID=UPI0038645664|nr:hypothetical protein OG268_09780 [Streptomyces uncialis]